MSKHSVITRFFHFFLSEYFTDALRITLTVVVPVVMAFSLGYSREAITIGLGALMISLTDSAGSILQKSRISLISIPLFFLLSYITASVWYMPVVTGVWLTLVVFGCSMLTVYGNRFYLLGSAAIIFMIFVLGFRPDDPIAFSFEALAGATWYYLVSLLQSRLFPFKSVRHSIAECIFATAGFLRVKALFYDVNTPIDEAQKQLLARHLKVNEKQEQLRSIILREPRAMNEGDIKGKMLLRASVSVIDLYEEITAVHYDYVQVRGVFRVSGVLELVNRIIELMSAELFRLGYAVNSGADIQLQESYNEELDLMSQRLQYIIERETPENALLLKKLQMNVSGVSEHIEAIRSALMKEEDKWPDETQIEYDHFVSSEMPGAALLSNISVNSPVFRFSLRLTLACVLGYILSLFLPLGNYSYWILLTIVIIMRPSFQHTVRRNKERLGGSLLGIGAGLILLYVLPGQSVQLITAIFFLLAFFACNRINYQVSVIFITVMVILCLNIYTGSDASFILERLVDTLIGCGIAFAAAYVFPVWESGRISFFMAEVLKANIVYLEKLLFELSGKPAQPTSYKLSRKDAYVSLANLSTAFNGMLSEPRRFSGRQKNVFQFQILNQMLTSVLSSLFSVLRAGEAFSGSVPGKAAVTEAIDALKSGLSLVGNNHHSLPADPEVPAEKSDWLVGICREIHLHCGEFSE